MARHAFWTIIIGDQPTAFRAPVRDDLLPTLKQLQRQTPDASIKWFQRGQLWDTPGDALDAGRPPRRGEGWRPGGDHKDPRDAYKVPRDVKRKRWAAQAAEGRGPWVRDGGASRPPRERDDRNTGDRPVRPKFDRGDGGRAPDRDRKSGGWGARPDGDRKTGDRPFRPKFDRGDGGRGPDRDRKSGGWGARPDGDRKPGDRPFRPKFDRGEGGRGPDRDRKSGGWGARPDGDRKPGDRPFRPKFDRGDGGRGPDRDRKTGGWGARPDGDRKPGDRPFRPGGDRKTGDRPFKPAGDRLRPEGKRDWREPRPDRDAVARGGDRRSGPSGGGSKTGWKPRPDGARPTTTHRLPRKKRDDE